MTRRLLLFTNEFPWSTQETFLENEMPFLSEAFEEIVLQPVSGGGACRPLPHNVTMEKVLWSDAASRSAFYKTWLKRVRTWRTGLTELARLIREDRRLTFAMAFRAISWAAYKCALEDLPIVKAVRSDPEQWVVYAYWGHVPALAVPVLAASGVDCFVRYHRVDLYRHAMDATGWLHSSARCFPWRSELTRVSDSLLISRHGLDYLKSNWPTDDSRLHLMRLGVPDRGTRPAAGDPMGPLVVVSCSNIVPVKQVDRIAALVAAMARSKPVHWHHFGDGEMAAIQSALQEAPEGLSVTLHGRVPNATVADFYRGTRVDLFVNLSLSEGVPVSIMEAISFDIPAVATAVDGTPEVVITGESGLLVGLEEVADPARLAQRIWRALEADGELAAVKPRELWRASYDSARNYASLAELLKGEISDGEAAGFSALRVAGNKGTEKQNQNRNS